MSTILSFGENVFEKLLCAESKIFQSQTGLIAVAKVAMSL
jgi:hypothetical protein